MSSVEQRVGVLEDIEAIKQLKGRYCAACDGGWEGPTHDAEALAAMFAEDAVFAEHGGGEPARGRAEIAAMMGNFRAALPFGVHFITNDRVTVDGDRAEGRWYVLIPAVLDGKSVCYGGIYRDELVRGEDGWRFSEVNYRTVFLTENQAGWNPGGQGA